MLYLTASSSAARQQQNIERSAAKRQGLPEERGPPPRCTSVALIPEAAPHAWLRLPGDEEAEQQHAAGMFSYPLRRRHVIQPLGVLRLRNVVKSLVPGWGGDVVDLKDEAEKLKHLHGEGA